jgi:hypothetical protein
MVLIDERTVLLSPQSTASMPKDYQFDGEDACHFFGIAGLVLSFLLSYRYSDSCRRSVRDLLVQALFHDSTRENLKSNLSRRSVAWAGKSTESENAPISRQ